MDGHRHAVTSADGPRRAAARRERMNAIASATMPREALAAVLPDRTLAVLDGQGHDALDAAPVTLAGALDGFFLS